MAKWPTYFWSNQHVHQHRQGAEAGEEHEADAVDRAEVETELEVEEPLRGLDDDPGDDHHREEKGDDAQERGQLRGHHRPPRRGERVVDLRHPRVPLSPHQLPGVQGQHHQDEDCERAGDDGDHLPVTG
jgi:hypothetical protein